MSKDYIIYINSGLAEETIYTRGSYISMLEVTNSDDQYFQSGFLEVFKPETQHSINDTVHLYIDDIQEFSGYISRRERTIDKGVYLSRYQLVGETYDLWRYHTDQYALYSGSTGYIASSLVSSYCEDITAPSLDGDVGIYLSNDIDLSNKTVGDAIAELAKMDGYSFYVNNGELHYYKITDEEANLYITEQNIIEMQPIEEDDKDIVNDVLVLGGTDYSIKTEVSREGSGSKIFPSGVLVAQRFTIEDPVLSAVQLYLDRSVDPDKPDNLSFEIWENTESVLFEDDFTTWNHLDTDTNQEMMIRDGNLELNYTADLTYLYEDSNNDVWLVKALTAGSGDWEVPDNVTSIDVLIVAGGGGSGRHCAGKMENAGGGGAGGLIFLEDETVTPGANISYSVGVGGRGGAHPTPGHSEGENGGNSVFGGNTAIGGGGGASPYNVGGSGLDGEDGGSGGGGAVYFNDYAGDGGTGTAGQGHNGADGYETSTDYIAGGGGGAENAGGFKGGHGSNAYGGDGRDLSDYFGNEYGIDGVFSRGGSSHNNSNGGNGETNTGNGGRSRGRSDKRNGRPGGSGIILIRWKYDVYHHEGEIKSNLYAYDTQYMRIDLEGVVSGSHVFISGTNDSGSTWKTLTDGDWVDFETLSSDGTRIKYKFSSNGFFTPKIDKCKVSISDDTGADEQGGGIPKSGSRVEWSDDIDWEVRSVLYPPSLSSWQSYPSDGLLFGDVYIGNAYWMVFEYPSSNSKWWKYYYDPNSTYEGKISYSWDGGEKWSSNTMYPEEVPAGNMRFNMGWKQGKIEASATNQESIDLYGRHFKKISDSTITTLERAQARADLEVSGMTEVPKKGKFVIEGTSSVSLDYPVSANLSNFDIDEKFKVKSYTHRIDKNSHTVEIVFGKHAFDIAHKIAELEYQVSK